MNQRGDLIIGVGAASLMANGFVGSDRVGGSLLLVVVSGWDRIRAAHLRVILRFSYAERESS